MIDDDDSDDEVPLASRVGVKKESSTPKRASPHARPARIDDARTRNAALAARRRLRG